MNDKCKEDELASNAFVRARIDEQLKNDATAILAEMGLTVSDIVRITLTRIAKDRALPFELSAPNAETRAAMQEAREIIHKRQRRYKDVKELFNGLQEGSEREFGEK